MDTGRNDAGMSPERTGTAAEVLLDIELLRQLKYRYFRLLDTKDWTGLAECFVPAATATYPQRSCSGRDEIVSYLSESMTPGLISMHHGHHPEITVGGDPDSDRDRATGVWYLHDKVLVPAFDFALEGAALYSDRYVRVDGRWLIAHTGYERVFETRWSTADLPSFTVIQGDISRGDRPRDP